ncbi:hypothetical protein [Streptomyces sp. NPDC086989]|uniref:hypothetical protein n=1 Tax=Streptomyces sp. NPDC086989 TaxID=3365764 RepID=UPI0038019F8F
MPWTVTTSSETADAPTDTATVTNESELITIVALAAVDPRQLSIHVQHVTGPEA